MNVLNTEMHLVTFLITAFESVMLFFAIIWYQSRPSEKARGRYVILLILLIQYNVYSGLFPDVHINIPIQIQLILAYFGGISVSMYFIYYVYKALELQRLKTIAVYGSIWCLFLPFIIFFIIPYLITGDADFSRKLVVIIPFAFTVFYVYTLTKSVWPKIRHLPSGIERQETLGLYISVLLWATLPVIVYFDGSQVVENGITNMGFMIMSVVFVRSAIFKSREDFAKLQESKEQLVQANETLLTKVKERTQELEIANQKRLNSFINLMHETKTPLTLINNCLDDLMQKYGASEETDITKLNLVKLNRNMNNFFDVHKLDRGIHIYDHSINIDFSEMIKNAIREFSPLGKRKGIIISSDIDEDILLKADPEAIYRVVDNLMENAIKYSNPDGQIYVQLKKDREFINLTIKDNGSGIAEEHQQKIFQPYYQIDHKKRNVQGMGMGLTLVKKIVESLQGSIDLVSDIGVGTEIKITIPNVQMNGDPIISIPNDFPRYLGGQPITELEDMILDDERHNILIIEDHEDLLSRLGKQLSSDYNICLAQNGVKAIQKLEAMSIIPDLILTDIMMDEMDGFDFVKLLREQKMYQHIPIIFLSAISVQSEKVNGLKLGAVDFISKPFDMAVLKQKIKSLLEINEHQKLALLNQASALIKKGNWVSEQEEVSIAEKCRKLGLTESESRIVPQVLDGMNYKNIADSLCIAHSTVSKHISNIYEKLDVKNKIELAKIINGN